MYKFILFLFILITSCSHTYIWPGHGKFICQGIEPDSPGLHKYFIESLEGHPAFWMIDTANKYSVGDTLYLTK